MECSKTSWEIPSLGVVVVFQQRYRYSTCRISLFLLLSTLTIIFIRAVDPHSFLRIRIQLFFSMRIRILLLSQCGPGQALKKDCS